MACSSGRCLRVFNEIEDGIKSGEDKSCVTMIRHLYAIRPN